MQGAIDFGAPLLPLRHSTYCFYPIRVNSLPAYCADEYERYAPIVQLQLQQLEDLRYRE